MNPKTFGSIAAVSFVCLSACGPVDMPDQIQAVPKRRNEGKPCYGAASDCQYGHCISTSTFGSPGHTGTTPEGEVLCYESDGVQCDHITGRCTPLFPYSDSSPPANICDWYQPTYLDMGNSVPKVPVARSSPHAKTVASGYAFSCAVLSDGTVKCWGDNSKGQLGLGVTYAATPLYIPPTVVPGLGKAVSISAYDNHACAVLADGHVACWGTWLATHGTAATVALSPVLVAGLENVVSLDVNKYQACAVDTAGMVWCWGILGYDGIENTESQQPMPATPSPILGISTAIAVSLTENATSYTYQGMACALLSSGQVQCWGHGYLGKEGLSPYSTKIATSSTPITVANVSNAIAVSGTCVLRSDGQVLCWGKIYEYDRTTGQGLTAEEPMEMVGLDGAVDMANDAASICILNADGHARCQALLRYPSGGGLGNGLSYGNGKAPVEICNVSNGVAIFDDWGSRCALLADGRLVCWGNNDKGQLGHGTLSTFDQPVVVEGL